MRRPTEIERLYLDFDGFFASVEQQVHPHLRGKPVGVVPFKDAVHTCVIACSREAKLHGVKNVMNIEEARERCGHLYQNSETSTRVPAEVNCRRSGALETIRLHFHKVRHITRYSC